MFGLFPFMSDRNNGSIFNGLFNEDLISNIIDQVINSDFIGELTNELPNEDTYNIEFKDCGEYYLIKGYLPGLNPKDVRIDFENNKAILTIKNKRVYSNSRNSVITVIQTAGSSVRTFDVEEIDTANLGASFKEDLLIITIPKARKALNENNPKIIEVNNFRVE